MHSHISLPIILTREASGTAQITKFGSQAMASYGDNLPGTETYSSLGLVGLRRLQAALLNGREGGR